MKGFALDSNGDLLIENNQIQMVNDDDLVKQTVTTVLGTNKKEWFLNWLEGINFRNILGKASNDETEREELARNEIAQGLLQVDSSFFIDEFMYVFDSINRRTTIQFVAKNSEGATIEGVKTWG